jgi:hypothetical protein
LKQADVRTLAVKLMTKHGLIESGWRFEWDKAETRIGCCHYGSKRITLSKLLVPNLPRSEVRNTILHEIAHALVGPRRGHGPIWQAKAIEVGARPEKSYVGPNPINRKSIPHEIGSPSCPLIFVFFSMHGPGK